MKLLDLYCGAGGGAVGYYKAGFTSIVGVDIVPQRNYPFSFIRENVLNLDLEFLKGFDVIHASPPCQAYSASKHNLAWYFPDIIEETRELLKETGKIYVIENIPKAPLIDPIMLCGTMFPGLRVIRHRCFESNYPLVAPPHIEFSEHPVVYSNKRHPEKDQFSSYITVTGGGNSTLENAKNAMGIDHPILKREINEAIPPAYTEYVGRQLIEAS